MSASSELPDTMRALVLDSTSTPPEVRQVPIPRAAIGSAVVKIEVVGTNSYIGDIYSGKRKYPFPTPLIPGTAAIGRIAEVGPDTAKLRKGDFVLIDWVVRARDDSTIAFIAAILQGYSEGSKKLMTEVYRDWTYAQYTQVPLECLTVLNEKRLISSPTQGGLGYQVGDLAYVANMLVPYGGLVDIDLKPGETVIVAPATGGFGGAAVLVALAMGARVIAMGRNETALENLKKKVPNPERLDTVPITGDMEGDVKVLKSLGPIDAFYEIGPAEAHASTHFKSGILALRHGGRVSLMGGYGENVSVPLGFVMRSNIRLSGKWMYERSDIARLVQMVESGVLKLGSAGGCKIAGIYPLEEYKEAWDKAAEFAGVGEQVLIKPS